MGRIVLILSMILISHSGFALNCRTSFEVKSPPNAKVARLMNQAMKHHWAFKELLTYSRELSTKDKITKTDLKHGYDFLLKAQKASEALVKAFTLILENKDGSWAMGGVVPGSEHHKRSNAVVAEIVGLYKQLNQVIDNNLKSYTKTKSINDREIDFLVMEIMDLSEQGHRLHK